MRQLLIVFAAVSVMAAAGSACATKKFVRGQVDEVNGRVETLGQSLEATQQQTKENTGRITQVDQRVDQVAATANAATNSAATAQTAANAAGAKADAVDVASKRLIFQVAINDAGGNFKFGKADLPDDVKGQLNELADKLKAAPAGNFIEIEGHTDNRGAQLANNKLGLDRAENVKRYLYETYQIPLHKINVISYGEEKPVSPNTTKAGRAQNRRVVIKVLA
ncbi:MAG: OmpA family protein [Vicinamibacterales bacterium]|nr:OmpA family protein [Vicinamibacterales bacterium]